MADIDMNEPEVVLEGDVETPAGEQTPYIASNVFQSEEDQARCLDFVCSEILDVRDGSDRASLVDRWQEYRRIRRAIPKDEQRSSPWIKAANIEPPLTQGIVHSVWAKETAAFFARKPLITVDQMAGRSITGETDAAVLQKFMNHLAMDRRFLNWRANWSSTCFNQSSMGTSLVKIPFLIDQYKFKRTGASGAVEDVTQRRHQGPAYVEIRLEDFYMRPYFKDIDRAPWVGVEYRYFAHELRQLAAMGKYDTEIIETLIGSSPAEEMDDSRTASLEQAKIDGGSYGSSDPTKEYRIYEVFAFWDVAGDGIPVDLILHIEADSKTLLRAEFNPLPMRDIRPVVYFDDPEVFYGVGLCEMCRPMQAEVATLHNMRLDGTQLAMLKIFIARTGCGISDKMVIEPGKILMVDNPQEDLRVESFPDIAPSCLSAEMIAREYAQKVTGVSDNMTGFNDKVAGTSATVGGTMFLTQQGNSILNAVLERAVQAATEIFQLAFYQCVANEPNMDLTWMDSADQEVMRSILQTPVEELAQTFRFNIQVTDFSKTDEARKQNFLASFTIYNQYVQQSMRLVGAMGNPQVMQNPRMKEMVEAAFAGATKLVGKVFDFLEVGQAADYLPFTGDIELSQQVMDIQREQAVAQARRQIGDREQGAEALGLGGGAGSPFGGTGGMGVQPGVGPVNPGAMPGPQGAMPQGAGPGPVV